MRPPLRFAFLGLSLSSSWGNGHATTYRALLHALAARGHDILFLEREQPWYAAQRDMARPDFCTLAFYRDLAQLDRWREEIATADAVVVGSYVPEGVAVAQLVQREASGVTAFYDIDTPVTLAKLAAGDHEYLAPDAIPGFDLYLSSTHRPRRRGDGISAISAPTAPIANRCSIGCCWSRRGACHIAASSSPGRSIRPASTGRATSSASSTCRRRSTRRSIRASAGH